MKFKKLPEFYWDDYWKHIYNRIERGLSWLFLSLGAIIILCFAGWAFLDKLIANQYIHPLLKVGMFIFMIGITHAGWVMIVYARQIELRSDTWLTFPLFWPQLAVFIGFLMLALTLPLEIVRVFIKIRAGEVVEEQVK